MKTIEFLKNLPNSNVEKTGKKINVLDKIIRYMYINSNGDIEDRLLSDLEKEGVIKITNE